MRAEMFRTLVRRNLLRLRSNWILLAAVAVYAIFIAFALSVFRINWETDDLAFQIGFACRFVLGATGFVSALLGVALGATLLSSVIKTGAIFAYLARPLSRTSIFAAAWVASASVVVLVDALVIAGCTVTLVKYDAEIGLATVVAFVAIVLGHLVWFAGCAALATRLAPAVVGVAALGWSVVVGWAFAEDSPLWLEIGARTIAAVIPLTELDENAITETAVGMTQDLGLATEALALRLVWVVLLVVLGGRWFSSREIAPHV